MGSEEQGMKGVVWGRIRVGGRGSRGEGRAMSGAAYRHERGVVGLLTWGQQGLHKGRPSKHLPGQVAMSAALIRNFHTPSAPLAPALAVNQLV